MTEHSDFKIICTNCDAVGIRIDPCQGAASSMVVKCGLCDAPRGTLAALREFAHSDRRDFFEG